MGKIYNSAYCTMLRDKERAKNPEIKRSSKEMSEIDNLAMVADMLMLESKNIKFLRGVDCSDSIKENQIVCLIYNKYPEVYTFLSGMYNSIIDPSDDYKKSAERDAYLENALDHVLKVLEILK